MGSKFANIQVHCAERPVGDVLAQIAAVFRQRLGALGYVALMPEEEGAERRADATVYCYHRPGSHWIAVFDEEVEFSNEAIISGWAAALSEATKGIALGLEVVDSDVLQLYLHSHGALIDRFSNDPHHPEAGPDSRLLEDYVGQPERWRELLADGATPAMLRDVLAERPIFIEELLTPLAALFGEEDGWGYGGWQDAEGNWRRDEDPGAGERHAGWTRLAFRSTTPPIRYERIEGRPRLDANSGPAWIDIARGDALQMATVVFGNRGGGSRGLALVIYGPALEAGLLEMTAVQLSPTYRGNWMHLDVARTWPQTTELALRSGRFDGRLVRYASLPDLPLHGGVNVTRLARGLLSEQHRLATQVLPDTPDLLVTLIGSAARVGAADLWLGVIPLENAESGRFDWHLPVTVREPAPLPLKATAREGGNSRLNLAPTQQMTALIAFGADRLRSAAVAQQLIEQWWPLITPDEERQASITLRKLPTVRSQGFQLPAQGLTQRRRWPGWCASMVTGVAFSGELEWPTAGFWFDAGMALGNSPEPEDGVSYLTLTYDASDLDAAEQERMLAALESLVDEAVAAGAGLQAFIARWKWWHPWGTLRTPYESACGIAEGANAQRVWVTRFLRGVTERIWLGPDLLAQLGDVASVEAVATVTAVGQGRRIVLKPDRQLAELERALAVILPGRADWDAAMQ